MFNFQKEIILNDINKAKVVDVQSAGIGKPKIAKKVRIHDGGEYFPKYIVDGQIYKTIAVDGTNFSLSLHMNELKNKTTSHHIQILVELGLDRDYRGDYGSALYYFRKPLLVDVVLPAEDSDGNKSAAVVREAFNKAIPNEYKFVSVDPTANANVVIKGVDSYQTVKRVLITEFEAVTDAENNATFSNVILDLSGKALDKEATLTDYTPNKMEFGTYDYLIHNLRLPTYENFRFTSQSAPEMPVVGAKYTQYSFAYCVPRPGMGGMSVAGQTNYSTTLHTIYVKDGSDASTFEGLFTTAAGEDVEIAFVPVSTSTAASEPVQADRPLHKTDADKIYTKIV